ncbi:Type III pantothenate kinase [Andreprevotia sp. IGB-42]|uniref:type III pantothenate kinase n=1 Tax=Andreprevotia sp. IGB-42 TaxID=2497473 RepID=UPI00135745C7|nr:type III pantothenate kinase [Andreprevotia sp. IGB-42]KAF0812017.1 Type III pantothenate kinase [Andreprevotia sp. IGB-42]
MSTALPAASRTRLLLDLGNTRLKWLLQHSDGRHEAGDAAHADFQLLAARFAALPRPEQIFGCSVASPALTAVLHDSCMAQWAIPASWLRVSRQALGVSNRYRQLEQQGPDRWAAILGAHSLYPGQALVVASAGTALTIDALTADGTFLGGMILPGYRLMKASLAAGTARLPDAGGNYHDFPASTEDAIETGVLTALAASVEAALSRMLRRAEEPLLLLAGGDATRIAPLLATPAQFEPDLVLRGLAALAQAKEFNQ